MINSQSSVVGKKNAAAEGGSSGRGWTGGGNGSGAPFWIQLRKREKNSRWEERWLENSANKIDGSVPPKSRLRVRQALQLLSEEQSLCASHNLDRKPRSECFQKGPIKAIRRPSIMARSLRGLGAGPFQLCPFRSSFPALMLRVPLEKVE